MKIFICWSKDTSHQVANALRDWLPNVIQFLPPPFVSSEDIDKGTLWSEALAKELKDAEFGIVCLTPYNLMSPWLHFEAGALSKIFDRSSVATFLFRVDKVEDPLSRFQKTDNTKEDVYRLVCTLNNKLKDQNLSPEQLKSSFDKWWPQLKKKLDQIENKGNETETGYEWLYTPADLRNIGLNTDYKAIWIVSSSLSQDLQDKCLNDLIKKNREREVEYTFIIKYSDTTDEDKENLDLLFSSHPKVKYHFKPISDETFKVLAATRYIAFDPGEEERKVFVEVPTKKGNYWIKVEDEEAILNFVRRFKKMIVESEKESRSSEEVHGNLEKFKSY